MDNMNRLSTEKRAQVIASLVEGNSIRATVPMTGVTKNTITKLLVDMGTICSIHQDKLMRNLTCERIRCDEIWAFVGAKQKNVPEAKREEWGDVWTWVALDADTKLVPTYRVGPRDLQEAQLFMRDVAQRLANRVQLTTDGHSVYFTAVKGAFPGGVDYGQLVKVYGDNVESHGSGRYSPPKLRECQAQPVYGNPDPADISTSYLERQNLTMRMSMRRFTRLTNAFSKKAGNLTAAVSLHFAHYNMCRVHSSIGATPAVAAGVADHTWTLAELIALLEAAEATPIKRGSYLKRQRISD
jgi:IS1 family transposase